MATSAGCTQPATWCATGPAPRSAWSEAAGTSPPSTRQWKSSGSQYRCSKRRSTPRRTAFSSLTARDTWRRTTSGSWPSGEFRLRSLHAATITHCSRSSQISSKNRRSFSRGFAICTQRGIRNRSRCCDSTMAGCSSATRCHNSWTEKPSAVYGASGISHSGKCSSSERRSLPMRQGFFPASTSTQPLTQWLTWPCRTSARVAGLR